MHVTTLPIFLPGIQHILQTSLQNDLGMTVTLLSYGASIQRLTFPYSDGITKNVVLSLESEADYLENTLYAGATLAPNAGRISNALLPIEGHLFSLSNNDGPHQLHGGFQNLSHQNWELIRTGKTNNTCFAEYSAFLPDGAEGCPGNRTFQVRYTLTSLNALKICYHAVTDEITYINMSNHSYFNLNGDFSKNALEQELTAPSSHYVMNGTGHIPYKISPVENTPFDFRNPSSLSQNIALYPQNPQTVYARGYNHAILTGSDGTNLCHALTLKAAKGCQMQLYTDAPCVVVYSGGFIGNGHRLLDGAHSMDSCAVALEAQDIPDAVHLTPDQVKFTTPASPFHRTIIYALLTGAQDTEV